MRTWIALLSSLLLCACASTPPAAPVDNLFHDERFGKPTDRVDAKEIFALNDGMHEYLKGPISQQVRSRGAQRGLLDALYRRGELKLEYEASLTRNASQAFDARAGNCLSLVVMTAAFAKELGIPVEYHSAYTEEAWSRSGSFLFRSGHVNVTLGRRLIDINTSHDTSVLTVDFLAGDNLRGLRTHVISEDIVVSMYMNNRAAEALVKGDLDNAYAWARESIRRSPGFTSAYNTLGLVYLHHGDAANAEQVFARALEREPANTGTMSNLASAMLRQGRSGEADALMQRVAQMNPYPPFHFFHLGLVAMQKEDFRAARDLFAKEVERAEYYHEFQFWLGLANYRLGDMAEARKHLTLAMESSNTRSDRDLYAAKLAWLRLQHQPH